MLEGVDVSTRPEGGVGGGVAGNTPADPDDAEATPPVTGLADVDRVLAREASVRELPIERQAAAYGRLHDELEAVLAREPAALPAATPWVEDAVAGMPTEGTAAQEAAGP